LRTNNARMNITLTYPTAMSVEDEDSVPVELEITDQASGMRILDIRLTPLQFRLLMSSHNQTVDGWLSPPEVRDRLGRKSVNETRSVPEGIQKRWESKESAELREWAESERLLGRWETVEYSHQNNGWFIILRRWVEAEPPND